MRPRGPHKPLPTPVCRNSSPVAAAGPLDLHEDIRSECGGLRRAMSDYESIKDAVFDYFEGYKARDRGRLERAFALDIANMMGYWKNAQGELELFSKPMRELIDIWTDPDYSPHEFSNGQILSIHKFSDVGATVVFDCGGRFLDTFQLAKIDGSWRIVNKFFVDQ